MGRIGVILRVPLPKRQRVSDEADFVGAELFAVCKMLIVGPRADLAPALGGVILLGEPVSAQFTNGTDRAK